MNVSYVRKADEGSRYASLNTPGVAEQDPAAPVVTEGSRRQRLLNALEAADVGQSLGEIEQLAAAALAGVPAGGAQ